MNRIVVVMLLGAATSTACGGDDAGSAPTSDAATAEASSSDLVGDAAAEQFPDIVGAEATFDDSSGTWSFAVTVSSPYDTAERYADGWRVVGSDGTVYGIHTLTHDHAGEQPFTRRQTGVEIPQDIAEVIIEGRDQANGFGGTTATVVLIGGDR